MKRHNYATDLEIYRQICETYFALLATIEDRTDFELEDRQQEKRIFRPVQLNKYRYKYRQLFNKAIDINPTVHFEAGGFSCACKLVDIIKFKRQYERQLVTPRHHVYYIDRKEQEAADKAA